MLTTIISIQMTLDASAQLNIFILSILELTFIIILNSNSLKQFILSY